MLDIRWPIGLMFSLIGAILVVYGVVTNHNAEMYKRSLDNNVNLVWGALLLAFGLFMLISAKLAANAEKKNSK
jgi:uncharacterized membrane protein